MRMKLLVIDTTTSITNPWKKALETRYDMTEAVGGVEAIRKLKAEKIDLVIVNISLKHINGVEAIGKIRGIFIQIPIIVLYDPRDVLDVKQAKVYGVSALISLPVDYKKLATEIQTLLANAKPAQQEQDRVIPHLGSESERPALKTNDDIGGVVDVEKRFYDGLSAISANSLKEAVAIFHSLLGITRLKKESWRRYLEDALFQLGQCYATMGDFAKSNSYYAAFINKAPHNTSLKSALLYMGKNYIALKNKDKAAFYLKKVINTPPFDSHATQARKLLKTIQMAK